MKKVIGLILLTLSIIVFTPFDDILWFPPIIAMNLPEIIIIYYIIGLICLFLALYLLGIHRIVRSFSRIKLGFLISIVIIIICVGWWLWNNGYYI